MLRRALGLGCAAQVLLANPAVPIEKAPVRAFDEDVPDWSRAAETISLSYFNLCTGWQWSWGGWADGQQLGVVFDVPSGGALLESTSHLVDRGAAVNPCGYGFTGVIEVYATDAADCPTGPPLASRYWCVAAPGVYWYTIPWGGVPVPQRFVVAVTFAAPTGFSTVEHHYSDHPAAGPTGLAACGLCYPTTRAVRTHYYGFIQAPLCPGEPINDGTCDVEMQWTAQLSGVTALEEESWAGIKGIYR